MNRGNSRSRGTALLAVAVVVLARTAATGRDGVVSWLIVGCALVLLAAGLFYMLRRGSGEG
jgi:hypothetical protein